MELMLIGYSKNGTPVFQHPEAHPHRIDLAAIGISKMEIPARPINPTDRNQTRVAATVNLYRKIGVNHLVETTEYDEIVMFDRGRGYQSRMVLKAAEPETRLTSVCFWDSDNNVWVLWTNFEGEEGLPEPGCDRYNNASADFKAKCDAFWAEHGLVPTEEELERIAETANEGIMCAITRMLFDEMLPVEEYESLHDAQACYATVSDVIDSFRYPVSYKTENGWEERWEQMRDIREIKRLLEEYLEDCRQHPESYEY